MENAKLIETKGARLVGLHAIQAVHDQATQVHKIYVTATWKSPLSVRADALSRTNR